MTSGSRPVPVVGRNGPNDSKVSKAEVHRTSDPDWLPSLRSGERLVRLNWIPTARWGLESAAKKRLRDSY